MLEEKTPESVEKSGEKSHRAKIVKEYWLKVKSLFLTGRKDAFSTEDFTQTLAIPESGEITLNECMSALDTLQPLLQLARAEFDPNNRDFSLESLGASTYLFHADRLLVKIREHFLNFRYRQEKFNQTPEVINSIEFMQVKDSCVKCYHAMKDIIGLIRNQTLKRLYSEELIRYVYNLELEATNIGSAMRSLNQVSYRFSTVSQMSQLENNLFETLTQNTLLQTRTLSALADNLAPIARQNGEFLREKVKVLENSQHALFINKLIDIHDSLKKCYVVARKSTIKDTLDQIGKNIELLISVLNSLEPSQIQINTHLQQIFFNIDSIRFSTNLNSRCSQILFEKAKIAKRQLRKACNTHPQGQQFLQKIALIRSTIVKKLS